VALSYVWGGSQSAETRLDNLEAFRRNGSLKDCSPSLPQTILDAIKLVRKMGLNYLWIDRLCIVQDDFATKDDAISNMKYIYHATYITIVTATGKDAAAGLPGVRAGSRGWTQPIEEIQPGIRLTTSNPSSMEFLNSKYNARGWTKVSEFVQPVTHSDRCRYQEFLLSNRRLVFLNGLMYFHCKYALWREDQILETIPDSPPSAVGTMSDRFSVILDINSVRNEVVEREFLASDPSYRNIFSAYAGTISSYTERQLSYQKDIINAYKSTCSIFAQEMHSDTFYGIPLLIFDWALLFRNSSSLGPKQRPEFPSWSWCGREGVARLEPITTVDLVKFMFTSRFVEWSYWNPWTESSEFLHEATPRIILLQDPIPKSWFYNYSWNGAKFKLTIEDDKYHLPRRLPFRVRDINIDEDHDPVYATKA